MKLPTTGDLFATGPANLQQIRLLIGQPGEEKAGHLALLHGRQHSPAAALKHFDAQRIRQVGAHDQPITVRVRAKNGKRVAMFGAHQRIDIGIGWQQVFTGHCHGRTINHWEPPSEICCASVASP